MESLKNLPFIADITSLGGEIFAVGGAVRDFVMKIESKDLDILIRKVPIDTLVQVLEKYGRCDLVGESFGIFKFKAFGSTDEIDIAIPRTERKTGTGHKDFAVNADPNISLADDLKRRDFTINAMAMDLEGEIIDLYGGMEDINDKLIRAVDKDVFIDDPLRMLRAIQFAARFNFEIELTTLNLITVNSALIKNISPERILIEFEKIAKKGDVLKSFKDLDASSLQEQLYDRGRAFYKYDDIEYDRIKTLGEYMFAFHNSYWGSVQDFKKSFPNADTNLAKEIDALGQIHSSLHNYSRMLSRVAIFQAIAVYPPVIGTEIFKDDDLNLFKRGAFPKALSELDCDGYDLLQLGLKGQQIGKMNKLIVKQIMGERIKNNKEEILKFAIKALNLV